MSSTTRHELHHSTPRQELFAKLIPLQEAPGSHHGAPCAKTHCTVCFSCARATTNEQTYPIMIYAPGNSGCLNYTSHTSQRSIWKAAKGGCVQQARHAKELRQSEYREVRVADARLAFVVPGACSAEDALRRYTRCYHRKHQQRASEHRSATHRRYHSRTCS